MNKSKIPPRKTVRCDNRLTTGYGEEIARWCRLILFVSTSCRLATILCSWSTNAVKTGFFQR